MPRVRHSRTLTSAPSPVCLPHKSRKRCSKTNQNDVHLLQALSFYKIFGYPTGLGALLVRRSAMPLLAGKLYFGGGTVAVSCADADVYRCWYTMCCIKPGCRGWALLLSGSAHSPGIPSLPAALCRNRSIRMWQHCYGLRSAVVLLQRPAISP